MELCAASVQSEPLSDRNELRVSVDDELDYLGRVADDVWRRRLVDDARLPLWRRPCLERLEPGLEWRVQKGWDLVKRGAWTLPEGCAVKRAQDAVWRVERHEAVVLNEVLSGRKERGSFPNFTTCLESEVLPFSS